MKIWREGAWRSGEQLLRARTAAERRRIAAGIELTSRVWAYAIAAGEFPGYRATRDAFCPSHRPE